MNTTRSFIVTYDATALPLWEPRGNESRELIFVLYAGMAIYHFLNRGVSYRSQGGLKSKALPYHAMAGIIEVLLFYSGFRCSILSVAFCLVHSITGLILVKYLRKGYSTITRPSYQAGCILRPIVMIIAYLTQKPSHYHDALVPIHAFIYTRAFFFLLGTIGPTTDFSKNVNSKYVYLIAISGGALISIGHCHKVWAVPLYLMTVHGVGKLNFWTKTQLDACRKVHSTIPFPVSVLCRMGFCALSIGDLPADSPRHVWAKTLVSARR